MAPTMMTHSPAAARAARRGISNPMAPRVSHTPMKVKNHGAYTHCDSSLPGVNNLGRPANRNSAVSRMLTTHNTTFSPFDIAPPNFALNSQHSAASPITSGRQCALRVEKSLQQAGALGCLLLPDFLSGAAPWQ